MSQADDDAGDFPAAVVNLVITNVLRIAPSVKKVNFPSTFECSYYGLKLLFASAISHREIKKIAIKLGAKRLERYLNLADDNFVDDVTNDIGAFVNDKNLNSVVVFPPVNNYRRFLIHKCVEEYKSDEAITTFSIGVGDERRTVVCYKAKLFRDEASAIPVTMGFDNSQTARKTSPTTEAAHASSGSGESVYMPPHVRHEIKTRQGQEKTRNVPTKQRRPDRQVYVPRARRSLNTSNTSADSANPVQEDPALPIHATSSTNVTSSHNERVPTNGASRRDREKSPTQSTPKRLLTKNFCNIYTPPHARNTSKDSPISSDTSLRNDISGDSSLSRNSYGDQLFSPSSYSVPPNPFSVHEYNSVPLNSLVVDVPSIENSEYENLYEESSVKPLDFKSDFSIDPVVVNFVPANHLTEQRELRESYPMSDSLEDLSQNGIANFDYPQSLLETTGCDDKELAQYEDIDSTWQVTDDINKINMEVPTLDCQNMIIGEDKLLYNHMKGEDVDRKELIRASQEINRSNRRIIKQSFDSDILVISDPNESEADKKIDRVIETELENVTDELSIINPKKTLQKKLSVNRDENDWDSIFDDDGECLDPTLMEELTATVGKVHIRKTRNNYESYQTTGQSMLTGPYDEAFAHVIEVYNFPTEFKTNDLLAVFSDYKDTGFEIKWVDDTHALIVFSNSKIAAEVLAAEQTMVRTRPLHQATQESRQKAKKCAEFLQPYRQRPETCAALARRLVSGALGVRLSTVRQERDEERKLISKAREKKRQAALCREAAWDGSLTSNNETDNTS